MSEERIEHGAGSSVKIDYAALRKKHDIPEIDASPEARLQAICIVRDRGNQKRIAEILDS